ncbi:hypothetical protein G7Y89_g15317 [Cudoniella acicularis]|uniref:Heterokaryon incompatibility domain-containing protein n=1 Tax=Cudoniella acicularis TaxID=354080 RepID=A0A8H4QQU9_9HELO|nr:hypothetical protein G7Y89_g15317 [Cudoniella acicularis]
MPGSSAKRQSQDLVLPHEKRLRIEPGQQNAERGGDEASSNTDKADQICRECRKIDFEGIFSEDLRSSQLHKIWGGRYFALPHIHPQSNCPLCRFFYHTRIPPSDETEVDPLYILRVFPAKNELGAWQLDFDNSPGFVVVPARDRQYRFNYQDNSGIIMELSNTPHAFCGRQIQPQVDLSLLKGWLEFCNINHRTLCGKFGPRLPQGFRVIDCLTRRIVSWETVARPKSYIALSYVWGNHVKDATTSKDSPLGPLHATIEDAILLTTGLGYQYLWIDRYCISQDNPIEKQLQIQNMNTIYEQSVVTIIAAAGDDPYYGLPGVSATPRKSQPHVKIGSRTLISTPYAKNEILQSKWNSRGWTYQEGLLSRRRLVFTDTQIYFQCNSMHCLESIYAPLEILHTFKNNRMRDQVEMSRVFPLRGLGKYPKHLADRLNEYLERSLTFEKDILDAFRGILTAFEREFSSPVKSFCGIPIFCGTLSTVNLEALVFGLSWSPRYKDDRKPKRRLGFPSWTWAGWELSQIVFHSAGSRQRIAALKRLKSLVDVSAEYLDGLVLPWNGNQDQILAQEGMGTFPVFLRICGLTLDVRIYPDGRISATEDEGGIVEHLMVQLSTRAFRKCAVQHTRSAYNIKEGKDGPLPFTFLVISHSDYELVLLLLYHPENSLGFERIDAWHVQKSPVESDLKSKIIVPESLRGWIRREVSIR